MTAPSQKVGLKEENIMNSRLKVVIIDDDPMVSLSLKTILEASGEIEVAAVGNDGSEALTLYKEHTPDVLLTDIRMEKITGLEGAAHVLKECPEAKILLLTTFNDDEYIVKALSLGAKGYILKQDFAAIAPAVMAVSSGQTVFGGEVMNKIPGLMSVSEADSEKEKEAESGGQSRDEIILEKYDINDKELGIIRLVADGLNNKEIADELFLSEGTVRNYLSIILEKLELRDRTQLAVFYLTR